MNDFLITGLLLLVIAFLFCLMKVIETLLEKLLYAEHQKAVTEEHLQYLEAVFMKAMERPAAISEDQMAFISHMVNSTKESN